MLQHQPVACLVHPAAAADLLISSHVSGQCALLCLTGSRPPTAESRVASQSNALLKSAAASAGQGRPHMRLILIFALCFRSVLS